MAAARKEPPDRSVGTELEENSWTARAWVYILWVVIGRSVYCKVGCTANPGSRLNPIISGIPERPFRVQFLPCLSMEQALLFERIFHTRLRQVRTKGEWFTHRNALRLSRFVMDLLEEAVSIFETFGYNTNVTLFDLGGKQPLLAENGFVRDVVD